MKPAHDLSVGWVFGLARSGSSITAYAAAAPWDAPVADEILGPWDRTEEPYNYPREQAELVRLFKASEAHLTPEIASLTRSIMRELADRSGANRLVSKHPHLRFTPEEFTEYFPDHRAVWIIRNPMRRLASVHARGWTSIVRPNHDLDYFREYAERWLALPEENRLVFESLKRDPVAYFAKIYEAWGWTPSDNDLAKAAGYQKSTYHGVSKGVESAHTPEAAVSENARSVPREAVDLYLRDPFMRKLFKRLGWSLRRYDYCERPPTIAVRVRRKLQSLSKLKDGSP